MFMSRKNVWLVPCILMAVMGGVALARAQGGPEPAACALEPLTLPLWDATPPAVIASTPVAGPGGAVGGDEIEAAVDMIVTCINSGEPRLMHAIFTDRYLAERFADPTTTYLPAFEQALDRNNLRETNQFALEGVSEITPLEDGRVSVTVALSNGISTFHDTLTLANQDGAWLIDGVTGLDPAM